MHYRRRHPVSLAALAASLAFAASAFAQTAATPAPAAAATAANNNGVKAWGITSPDLPADPDVVFGVLPNGMRYAIERHENPQGAASVRFGVRVGAKDESDALNGAAHFVEHMAFNGSKNIPEGQLVPMLERLGLSFGADTNAETAFDHTIYKLDLPNTKTETVDAALEMMREVAGNLTIAPEAVQRERGVIMSEASVRNDPNRRRIESQYKAELPGNQVGARIAAVPERIANITADQLKAFYHAYYRPESATLVVVGDVDPGEMARKIVAAFGDWKPVGKAGAEYTGPVPIPEQPVIATFTDPAIPEIVVLDRAKAYTPPANTVAEERTELLQQIAGLVIGNRLQPIILQPDSPILGAQFVPQDVARNAKTYGLLLVARDGQWAKALAIGEQELRRAQKYGFTAGEIDEVKANYLAALTNAAAQAAGRKNASIADALMQQSLENAVPTAPTFDLAFYKAAADSITPETVAAAFRDAWQGAPTLVHVSTKSPIPDAQKTIAEQLARSAQVAVSAPSDAATKPFAYDSFGAPGKVVADTPVGDLGIRTLRFANGLELNLKHTDWEPERVVFDMEVGPGAEAFPADKPGIDAMATLLLPQDGLAAHSATELRKILAGHQVSLAISPTADALTAQGTVPASDLELQLKLLAARLTATGFRPETAAQWPPLAQTLSGALSAQPIQVWQLSQNYVLTGGDGRFGVPDPAALSSLTFDDMKAAIAPQLAKGPVALALVGDFDEDAAIAAVAKTLGALPSRSARTNRDYAYPPVAFKAQGLTMLHHGGQPNQGVLSISWPTDDDHDQKDSLTRKLLAAAMGLEALDLVREKLGATYTPQATSYDQSTYTGFGHIDMIATAGPADMDRIAAAFRQIAQEMRDAPISADLLKRAREPIIAAFDRADKQNSGWVALAVDAQSRPEVLDRRRKRDALLTTITPADIQAAAKQYLVDGKSAEIRVVPAAKAGE